MYCIPGITEFRPKHDSAFIIFIIPNRLSQTFNCKSDRLVKTA